MITGGNSGIGLATAQLFVQEGAKVAITGRNPETLAAAKEQLGENALTFQADANDHGKTQSILEEVTNTFGKLDVLFLNAGIAQFAPLEHVTPEFYDAIMNTNVKAPYFMVQAAQPFLNDGASIIFNTSVVNNKGMHSASVYAASKAALRNLTRGLATELAPRQIRVNAVSPGPIETPIWGRMDMPQENVDEMGQAIVQTVPLARFGKATEIAKTALFLANSHSEFITGAEIAVDGGMTQV